jgi:hypothetical protein
MSLVVAKPTGGKLAVKKPTGSGWTITPRITWNESVWNPSMILTALWLDASDVSTVTESGGLVSQVNDKSGNGRNFTASSGARPTYSANTLNSRAVFTFGGSQWLTSTNAASTWNFLHNTNGSTVIAVWKAGNNSNPNAAYPLCGTNAGSATNRGLILFYDDRAASSRNNRIVSLITAAGGLTVVNNVSADDAIPANTAVIVSHNGDPGNATAANRSSLQVNGGSAIATNTNTASATSSNATFTLQLGSDGNSTLSLTGYVAEFIVLTSIASTEIRQKLEGYLAHKWGLTANLPAGHPYKTVGPTP